MTPIRVATTWGAGRAALTAGLLALVVYLPSVTNGFALDDVRDVQDNATLADARTPAAVVLSPYRGDVPSGRSPYRPVTSLSFWLNGKLSDGAASSFHLVNVLLHALATVLVVLLLAALGTSPSASLAGGLVFAVHPVHVEAVAGIVGRAELLMTVFCLVAALVFLAGNVPAVGRAAVVALMYALALGAKENGVVLPGLLALLLLVVPRRPRRREWLVLAPTTVVLGGYLALRHHILGTLVHRDTAPYITLLPTGERVTTAVANLLQVGRLLIFPADLAADYGPRLINPVGLASGRFWLGLAVVGVSVLLGVLLYRRMRLVTLALAWIGISILVVSNLVIPIGVWIAERTLYLPSVGVSLVAAALVGSVVAPRDRRAMWLGLAVLLGAAGWKVVDRIPAWRDTETALRTLAEEHPESYRAEWWLASGLTDAGNYEAGLHWFAEAREADPNDLGLALDDARALLLADRPADAEALLDSLPPSHPSRYVYLVQSKIMTGRRAEAQDDVRAGLERFPKDPRLIAQARDLGVEIP